jgi:hypothetical protein
MTVTFQQHRISQIFNTNRMRVSQHSHCVKHSHHLAATLNSVKNETTGFTLESNHIKRNHRLILSPKSLYQWVVVITVLSHAALAAVPSETAAEYLTPSHKVELFNNYEARFIRDTTEERDSLVEIIGHMKQCKKIVDRNIHDVERFLPSQSYVSMRCERIFNTNQIVSDQLGVTLSDYGIETCLPDCDATITLAEENILMLKNKIDDVTRMRVELDSAIIAPDDQILRGEIRKKINTLNIAITESRSLIDECKSIQANAGVIRNKARLCKNAFIFNCEGVFSSDVNFPDLNNNPPDTAFFNMRAYETSLKALRGKIETEIVLAHNQLLASPRLG